MESKVRSIGAVDEPDLPVLRDRLADDIDIFYDLLIVRVLQIREAADMGRVFMKARASHGLQFFNQVTGLPVQQGPRKQDAVNQHVQLRILQGPGEEAGSACRAVCGDLISRLPQCPQIVVERLPAAGHAVIFLQQGEDLTLSQPMILVGILLQDLQDHHVQKSYIT